MREFLLLLGQLFMIGCLQMMAELFIDADKRPYQAQLLNIACFLGGFYLLIQFAFAHVLAELMTMVRIAF